MQLLRLVAGQIKVAAPLPFNVRDEHGQLLLAAGQVIASEAQLQTLLGRGLHADAEEVRAVAAGRSVKPLPPSLFARWARLHWNLEALSRLPAGAESFRIDCEALGDELQALVAQQPDVAIYQMLRQEGRPLRMYGLSHAVLVAALCQLLSARLQWPAPAQRTLVMAALTMNLTVLPLQGDVAVYGRLSDEKREQLRGHPDAAVALLRAGGVTDEDWLRAVAEHHEHRDGLGYPRGLREVGEPAQLLRLADVFLAKITRREGRPAVDVRDAERQAFSEFPGSPLVAALVKEIGIYPPGEWVCLVNGERALVARRGASMQTPLVMALTDRRGAAIPQAQSRDCARPEYAIRGVEADHRQLLAQVPMERVYGPLS
jgi:hypothetical protein